MEKLLIVIDVQNDFVNGALGTEEAQEILPYVVDKMKQYRKGNIIATKDTHFDNYLKTQEGSKLPVEHCVKNTLGWEFPQEISEYMKEYNVSVIEKQSFASVELVEKVKQYVENGLKEVEIIGICTDICVVSNALLLKGHFPELKIKVDSACCAGTTVENHNHALSIMRMCQIEISE